MLSRGRRPRGVFARILRRGVCLRGDSRCFRSAASRAHARATSALVRVGAKASDGYLALRLANVRRRPNTGALSCHAISKARCLPLTSCRYMTAASRTTCLASAGQSPADMLWCLTALVYNRCTAVVSTEREVASVCGGAKKKKQRRQQQAGWGSTSPPYVQHVGCSKYTTSCPRWGFVHALATTNCVNLGIALNIL